MPQIVGHQRQRRHQFRAQPARAQKAILDPQDEPGLQASAAPCPPRPEGRARWWWRWPRPWSDHPERSGACRGRKRPGAARASTAACQGRHGRRGLRERRASRPQAGRRPLQSGKAGRGRGHTRPGARIIAPAKSCAAVSLRRRRGPPGFRRPKAPSRHRRADRTGAGGGRQGSPRTPVATRRHKPRSRPPAVARAKPPPSAG